jgi:hypothetical protein
MGPSATLPPLTKFGPATEATIENFTAILSVRSKTVKIPGNIRVKMQALKAVHQFWDSAVGKQAYATLLEEQKEAATKKPKAMKAGG